MNRSATTDPEPAGTAGPDRLPGLLRAHATGGRLSQTASVNLLIDHGYWLTQPTFTDRFVHLITIDGRPVQTWIDWDATLAALDRGRLGGTGSQADLLRIAASLAAAAHQVGEGVVVLDLDPQKSLAEWHGRRELDGVRYQARDGASQADLESMAKMAMAAWPGA